MTVPKPPKSVLFSREFDLWLNEIDRYLNRSVINMPGASVSNLSQTVSNPPTQAEVQMISNKIDELLNSLRNRGVI